MKPYSNTVFSQEELFNIIRSLETLEMDYRITTSSSFVDEEWVRCWNIDELGE